VSAAHIVRLAVAAGAALAAGCGMTHLQTARTAAPGTTVVTLGGSLIHTSDRGSTIDGVPIGALDIMVRHGLTERLDFGVRSFFGLGLLADAKWGLLRPDRATALSLSAGVGAARDAGTGGDASFVAHVPVTLTASRALLPWLTPYLAVGYGAYWIFGRSPPDPSQSYAPRTWTGDGLLMIHAGIELARASGRAVMFEYTYARPVVDDPGDFYGFATNQFFSLAFHTGRDPTFSR
jgi:hypothetical protein